MNTILHNQKVCFTDDGRLEVYDSRLATRLNKHFKKFDDGKYIFKKGEECFYSVPLTQLNMILEQFLVKKSTGKTNPGQGKG